LDALLRKLAEDRAGVAFVNLYVSGTRRVPMATIPISVPFLVCLLKPV
jgi:hypothetical protein